ncbi:hypothetical protein Tco_0620738 [Tanacetum coccineum]
MFNGASIILSDCTLDVQRMESRFILSLRNESRLWLVILELHDSIFIILGSSSTPIYSPGASTTPIYSPGSSSTLIYSPGALRNAECSNCKHLLDKITVLEAMLEMYKNPRNKHTYSAALLHEVYNDR